MHEGAAATRLGRKGIPSAAEEVMILRDLSLVELTGGRLHVAHVSTAGGVRAIREAKRRGLAVSAEVTPHHLLLTDDDVAASGYDTDFKMNPPLRSKDDVEALRQGLAEGTIDCIATDHAPHSAVEKDLEFDVAANGIVGLETAFSVCLALARSGVVSEKRLVEAFTASAARAFRLPGGSLTKGATADVAVFDPTLEWRCDPACFRSKSRNSPWKGSAMIGRCTHTIVGGRLVFEIGKGER
jgi:dihydroorotase